VADQREASNPLLAGEPAMSVSQAAAVLGHAGTSALRKRLLAGTLRGLAPYSDGNPSREWVVSRSQIEAEAANRGRGPIPVQAEESTLADLRAEMLQGALSEEKDRRIADLERRLSEIVAEKDARLTDKDARIAQLELQVAALGRSLAEVTAAPRIS
jgi:hypothetical protein